MGTSKKTFLLNTHLGLANFGSFSMFLCRKMVFVCEVLWAYLHPLFRFIIRYVFRFHVDNSNCAVQENIKVESVRTDQAPEQQEFETTPYQHEIEEFENIDSTNKDDLSSGFLKFKFPTFDEFSRSFKENDDPPKLDLSCWTSTSKYDFMSTKSYTGFMENPEIVSCSVDDLKALKDGFLLENDFVDQRSIQTVLEDLQCDSSHEVSVVNHLIDSNIDGVLSDQDFDGKFDIDAMVCNDEETTKCETVNSNDETDMVKEIHGLETELVDKLNSSFLSENDFGERKDVNLQQEECLVAKDDSKILSGCDSEELNGLETLWEHQDLIEQLKMELKKVRAIGMPTIFEDSESPKVPEDFKPWKIEEKLQHEGTIDELQKFYKSYKERMRKFDILNYQKMYALGFLQAKDPLQPVSTLTIKSANPPTKSVLLEKLVVWKPNKKPEADPTAKFIKELHSDLEMVYVGQMCLSWEFLYWQYEKALQLWESDPQRIHAYNQVSSEFQQFQVLVQRFIENEAFEGPRVQNYVKNRCVLRNLLQVPVIRADGTKRRNKGRSTDESDVTSDKIVELIEESIRLFWQFVKSDKQEVNTNILKHRKETHIELQDPEDHELLSEVRATLQKKEKRLKDILRTGNCILRRFQKNRSSEESSDQVLYFFSQVDMKLVARVLNMPRVTTEQLTWCHSKLTRINFVDKRIHVDSSFLLFPC